MKKAVKIILIVFVVLLLVASYFGYQVYQMVAGSEPLTGKHELIPSETSHTGAITKGEADWPNWRGPAFDGKSTTTGIKIDWSQGLEKLWQVDFLCQDKSTASWSSVVVQGNRLVVPGRDEKNDLVFCLDPETGELIWKGSYEAEANTSHGPGSRATPFIDNDRVYTFGRSGDLVCWSLDDGALLWRKNVKDLGGEEPDWGFSTSPFVLGDKVFIQGGGTALVIAYDKRTGDVAWKSLSGKVGYSAMNVINIDGEPKLLVYHAEGLSCLNPNDGKELWEVVWATEYGVNATTPTVVGDVVFHTSGYGMGAEALRVSKDGYEVLWESDVIAAQHSDPVIIDGYIYGYSGDSGRNKGLLKCVNLTTGKEIWSTDKLGMGTLIYVDGHIICQDLKGNLFLLKPNPGKIELIGEIKNAIEDVKNPAWTVPAIANGKLYLRYLQRLVCYDLNEN